MSECYVCTDISYTLSPCKCKNLYLHQDCYAKLLAYNNKQCGVCLEPFPLPDLEAPEIYVKPSVPVQKVESLCIPILMGRPPIGIKDLIMEPVRHTLYLFLLFNLLKFIIFPSTYTFAFVFTTSDILTFIVTTFVYLFLVITVRGTCFNNNNNT